MTLLDLAERKSRNGIQIHSDQEGNTMAFELPDLPYAHDALASKGMSKETLEYHHDIHHNTYVTTLNKLIDGTEWPRWHNQQADRRPMQPKQLASTPSAYALPYCAKSSSLICKAGEAPSCCALV